MSLHKRAWPARIASSAVPLRLRPPRTDQLPLTMGNGRPQKAHAIMDTDSRKAERNSFAHHCASRLLVERATHIDTGRAPYVTSPEELARVDIDCANVFPIRAAASEARI